jgi:hypothetical protein
MPKKDKKELELEFIYNELFDKMVELVLRYNQPQEVASTMVAQALRLYKTIFKEPGEFESIIATIAKTSKYTQPFNHKTLH